MRQWISSGTLAQAMFLLVFPAFFAYQALAAFSIIPPAIGGGLTLFSGLALAVLAPAVLTRMRLVWPSLAALAALSLIVLGYALYYHLFGLQHQRSLEVALSSVKLVVGWGGIFAMGLFLGKTEPFRRVLFWAILAMAVLTPFLVKTPAMSLDFTLRMGWNVASYQFFAGALVITAILAISYSWARKSEPWLIALSVTTMFFLLSRSEQVGLIAVVAGWCGLKVMHRQFRPIAIAIPLTACLLGASLLIHPYVPALVGNRAASQTVQIGPPNRTEATTALEIVERQAEVLNMSGSESWGERVAFMAGGVDDILRSPIVGDYAGQVRDFGLAGAYIHNGLSAWSQYGLVAFILYMGGTIAAFALSSKRVLLDRDTDAVWLSTAMISGFCLLLVVFAKSVYWPMPALAWGMATSAASLHLSPWWLREKSPGDEPAGQANYQ